MSFHDKTFLGVSIFKPRFSEKKSIVNYLRFLRSNFNNLTVVIADLPEVINLMVMEGLEYEIARSLCLDQGLKIKKHIRGSVENVDVILWGDIEENVYPFFLELDEKFNRDIEFRSLLIDTVMHNLKPRYGYINDDDLLRLSGYLLQEIAQTIYFNLDLNYVNEVYPSGLSRIKRYIAEDSGMRYRYFDARHKSIQLEYDSTVLA